MAGGSVGSVRMDLSFKNAAAVIANIYNADRVFIAATKKLVREAGQYNHDLAYFLAAFDTGFMREHLRVLYGAEGYSFEVGWYEEDFVAAGLAFYPIYVEFGTRFMAAQPALYPAYRDTKEWFLPALSNELRAAANRLRAR